MDKNSVIGFILIALIFIGFTFFQSDRARKAAELQAQQDSIDASAADGVGSRARVRRP